MTIKNILTTREFDRSLKKLKKKHYDISRIAQAVFHIAHREQDVLIRKYKWHLLKGDKAGINEIHLDRDWLLLYEITDNEITILLLDTGSHDSVFKHA
ncbi:type II toxin-antitoxin system RelE/ParE family toxin [Levilactobacillus yiduensis]|uniref:type II toxin-antitoxin system RelE/ParE family toxin n=1 Tax=Levilactobacillus yiduensis TaxID=2953880 RepID=UPI001AD84A61|nr:type II toxin-antitoxin system YafQ family toxin [Levilactobacillus yiduensis]